MKRPLALACSLLAGLPAFAEQGTATLDLVSEGDFNKITLTFEPPFLPAGTGQTTMSGTVQVLLEIDPATDQVSEMTIISGGISGTALTIQGSNLAGSYDLSSTALGAVLDTPNPPGLVDPATGEFDASQHTFTVNSGMLSGTISVPLFGINETIAFDFSVEPVGGAGSVEDKGSVTLTPTGSTPTEKSYEVVVILPIDVQESFEVEGPTGPLAIPISATGDAKLVGPVTIPVAPANPYVTWTEANAIPGALFPEDENRDGVPNGLQWALGLSASELPFPHLLQPVGDTGTTVDFTVTLPGGGSAAEITVLTSDDPEGTPFAPLATGAVSSGNPIPAGTVGTVTISLPKNASGFVQLSAMMP